MRKVIAMLPVVSAIYPMITGATAPPTIVMLSNEEASLVFVPTSLNASEKIVGNIMLSPRYRAKNAMRDKVAEGGFVLGVVELHIAQSIIIN